MSRLTRKESRERRHKRLRRTVRGTQERPRLCVCFTSKNIYVQVIDDDKGQTLAAVSTLDKEVRAGGKPPKNSVATAKQLGALAAKRALERKISQVVFDRGGFQYTGKVKALADAAREGGLKF